MNHKKLFSGTGLLLGSLVCANSVMAAGFEKAVFWSGHYAGIGGAAASSVNGAEALYFNPAGLSAGRAGEFTLNVSPTFIKFTAPFVPNFSIDSTTSLSPVGSILASYAVNPRLTFGVGAYLSGGSSVTYKAVDFTYLGFQGLKSDISSSISFYEFSLGAGYEVTDDLKIGFAYRIVGTAASITAAVPKNIGGISFLVVPTIDGLKATNYDGFRLGVQYEPKGENYGLGLSYRSQIRFTAGGSSTGRMTQLGTASAVELTGGAVTVTSYFPQQFELGGHYRFDQLESTAFFQYAFTNYSQNSELVVIGNMVVPSFGNASIPLSNISQSWSNMHNLRFGYEYEGIRNVALRAGFVFTSQVSSSSYPSPLFSPPGTGQTYVVGVGTKFMRDTLNINGAFEYSTEGGVSTLAISPSVGGAYYAKAYAAHLGATYKF